MPEDSNKQNTITVDGEEVKVPEEFHLNDSSLGKTRRLRFQEIGDASVLHYIDKDTEETVYIKYVKIDSELRIDAYLYKGGKIINITSQQPVQD